MNTIVTLFINAALSLGLITVAFWLPHLNIYAEKAGAYECGFDPMSSARLPFSMKFFLIGITFLLFDLEITLLLPLPWAMHSTNTYFTMLVSFLLVSVLALGLMYEWANKGLEWTE